MNYVAVRSGDKELNQTVFGLAFGETEEEPDFAMFASMPGYPSEAKLRAAWAAGVWKPPKVVNG